MPSPKQRRLRPWERHSFDQWLGGNCQFEGTRFNEISLLTYICQINAHLSILHLSHFRQSLLCSRHSILGKQFEA